MIEKVVSKTDLKKLLDQLASEQLVAAPVADGPIVRFQQIKDSGEIAGHYIPTAIPPRKYVLPTKETLFKFTTDQGQKTDAQFGSEDWILYGVRPCDLHAIELMDEIFSETIVDGHYISRREHLTLIGKECLHPCDENCFCESMGTLRATSGFDLLITDLGDSYYVKVATPAGKALIDRIPAARDAVYEDRVALRNAHQRREDSFEQRLDTTYEAIPALLDASRESLLWDVLGEKCVSCGACTNVCPTCYCFDVKDEVNLDMASGERYRTWDSCQLEEFAQVGSGESFREHRPSRVKHRFYRKGKYILERYGMQGCVGCGRCARACLVDISVVETFNQLKAVER